MLQKDGFFRRRDEGLFRQNQPIAPTPAPAANAAPASSSTHAETRVDERKEAKLVVGPDIKMKGAELSGEVPTLDKAAASASLTPARRVGVA